MISAVAQFLGCLVMMFVTEWRMALAAIAVTALGFLIMAAVMLRSQKYFTARQENLSTLNGYIEEMYSGHDVVRLSRANEQVKETFGGMNAVLVRRRVAQPVPLRHPQPLMTSSATWAMCGRVRVRPGHERRDLLRRHCCVHPLCAAVHLLP